MRRSFAHIWGPALLGGYFVCAAVAAFLLAPSCIAQAEAPASHYGAVRHFSQVVLAAVGLLAGFAVLGLVLAVAAGTFVDWVGKEVRAWKDAGSEKE
jgi:hypothetical protein